MWCLYIDHYFDVYMQDFIMNQDWNDPKSQLQQCCLTLRELDGGEPDIPVYKSVFFSWFIIVPMYVVLDILV